MELYRRELLTGAAALGATAALPAFAAASPEARARVFLDETTEALLADYPENASALGIDTGVRAALKSKLTDRSAAGDRRHAREAAARLTRLRAIDRTGLSPQTALDLDVVEASHVLALDGWRIMPVGDVATLNGNVSYRSTPYIVSQGTGSFAETPSLIEDKHGVATAADADAYLARLTAYAASLDDETARIRDDAAKGAVLPGFLNDITRKQLEDGAVEPVADWSIVRSFSSKVAKAGLTGDWAGRAAAICKDQVAPALLRQAVAFGRLRPTAPADAGVWAQNNGDAYYDWLARAGTTTATPPGDIHKSGLAQCAALAAKLDPLLVAQGLTKGTVGERLAALGKRPDLLWPNTNAGRAELLTYLNGVVAKIRPLMPRAFNKLVPGRLIVQRVPPAIQNGMPNGYAGAGAIDGSTPGIYNINLRDTQIWPRHSLPTLTFHEGIPGHIWQGEYLFKLPLIRNCLAFNAYSEGWALYAEQLADEVGFYDGDPLGRIGYLQSMNFRAARLVADTGLHHERWSFDKALQFFMATTGYTESQARSELNRYCAWPGQALGYKTGHNEINRLRERAKARLGARYDFKAFNDLVVGVGGVPLNVLAQVVERWDGRG